MVHRFYLLRTVVRAALQEYENRQILVLERGERIALKSLRIPLPGGIYISPVGIPSKE
jgi:hypothetical protein